MLKFIAKIIPALRPRTSRLPGETPDISQMSQEIFERLTPAQRIVSTIRMGDTGDTRFYTLLKWCIEFDPEEGVRFAALKRMFHFREQDDLREFLERLDKRQDRVRFEPYLTMTLFRVGVIDEDQMRARLNSA